MKKRLRVWPIGFGSLGAVGRLGIICVLLAITMAARTSSNPCDLNQDGVVNATDVQLAINMALGIAPCSANVGGQGVCNVAIVQRVINSALGAGCQIGGGAILHSVVLNWIASDSPNIAGYNVYRGSASGGPYTKVNLTLIAAVTFSDNIVAAGNTYYYVSTAVDTNNNESAYSNEAMVTAPTP